MFALVPLPSARNLPNRLCAACGLQAKIIPESILQMCIKVSNEPPSDMKSNMRRAFAAFTPEAEERLSTTVKRTAYKSILFGLCFYHSLLLGRKKFGTGIGTGVSAHHPSPPSPMTTLHHKCFIYPWRLCLQATCWSTKHCRVHGVCITGYKWRDTTVPS